MITGYSVQYAFSQKKIPDAEREAKAEVALDAAKHNSLLADSYAGNQKIAEPLAVAEQALKKCQERK